MQKKIFKILRYTGLPFFIREFVQRNRVTIAMFHNIRYEDADRAFNFLSKHYNIIALEQYLQAIEQKTKKILPTKSLIITFDDGHIDNYQLLPLFVKYNIRPTIFLCSGIIGTSRNYWFRYENGKYNSMQEWRNMSNYQLWQKMSFYGFEKEKEYPLPQALQTEQIEEMKPYVDFQAHTQYHPYLPMCDDETATKEIIDSKRELENRYNLHITSIAYPLGDYSDRDILFCKRAGYVCGLTVDFGYNNLITDPFHLKRISISDSGDVDEVCVRASGFYAFLKFKIFWKQNYGYVRN